MALSGQQDGQLSDNSGSDEDAPPISRLLEAQGASSEDTSGDETGAAAHARHSSAEMMHSSAAPVGTLLEQEVLPALACAPALSPCSIMASFLKSWGPGSFNSSASL